MSMGGKNESRTEPSVNIFQKFCILFKEQYTKISSTITSIAESLTEGQGGHTEKHIN